VLLMSSELSSLTDVANMALSLIGEKTINNINTKDDTTAALMKRWTERCIREVQNMVNWDELYTGPVLLQFKTDEYAGVFGQYQYLLPPDYLYILESATIQTNIRTGVDLDWKMQDNFLIARFEGFQMFYQRIELSPAKWSEQMTQLVIIYLASKVAYNVTNDRAVASDMKADYQVIRAEVTATRQNRARKVRFRPRNFSMARQKNSVNPRSNYFLR